MMRENTTKPTESAKNTVSAPVDEVCLMEDRARVTRRGALALRPGRQTLIVHGVSPILVDKTLVVAPQESSAGFDGVDARVVREVVLQNIVLESDVDQNRSEVGRLREARKVLEMQMQRRTAELERNAQEFQGLTRTVQLGLHELVADASWNRPGTSEDFLAIAELRNKAMEQLDQRVPLEQAQHEAQEEIRRLDMQIQELQSPAELRRAYIEIDIASKSACEAKIQIDYSVPGACWRPAHRAELIESDDTQLIRFETDACVWQNTGEDWPDVQLLLSTERASLGVEPPQLQSDLLSVQRKNQTLEVEARDQAIDVLAPGGAGTAKPELPGIDDGGTALTLRAPQRSHLPSDGRPHRIFLSAFESPAEVSLVAMPELSPCVLRKSELENRGEGPLLAGPVDLLRESGVVGHTSVLYVASGERFELGWGPESELRLHRSVESSSESSRVLSSWRVKHHDIKVRVSNIGEKPHQILVTERVPVSEIDKVKIEVESETTGRQPADENGFVKWTLAIAPGAQESLVLRYKVKKHEDVQG